MSKQHARLRVDGDAVSIENLSEQGTFVNGVRLEPGWHPLAAGSEIRIASGSVLRLEKSEVLDQTLSMASSRAVSGMSRSDAKTIETGAAGMAESVGMAETERVRAKETRRPTDPGAGGGSGPTHMSAPGGVPGGVSPTSAGGGDDEGLTREQYTRRGGPGEVAVLRARYLARRRRRVGGVLLAVVAGLVAALVFLPPPKKPENPLSWPKLPDQSPIEGHWSAPNGGYEIVYPGVDPKVAPLEGGVLVDCVIGSNRDVRMTIRVEEWQDREVAGRTLTELFDRWMAGQSAGSDHWRFDPTSSTPNFLGERYQENGIPVRRAPYVRQERGRQRAGVATAFRHGIRFMVLCAEVPFEEKDRAVVMLNCLFVNPELGFLRRHWEGGPVMPGVPAARLAGALRAELAGDAPSRYATLATQIGAALCKAVAERDEAAVVHLNETLAELRQKQALWFNNQAIKWKVARNRNDKPGCERIEKQTQAVFHDPSDSRFLLSRSRSFWAGN